MTCILNYQHFVSLLFIFTAFSLCYSLFKYTTFCHIYCSYKLNEGIITSKLLPNLMLTGLKIQMKLEKWAKNIGRHRYAYMNISILHLYLDQSNASLAIK